MRLRTGYHHPAMDDPELRELVLPALRRDIALRERYQPAAVVPLPGPVLAVRGDADELVSAAEAAEWRAVAAPLDDGAPLVRATVRAAWVDALGHADFTDDDAFFVVGGTSLKAIRVLNLVSRAVGLRLRARLLFDHQTVGELAAAVGERLAGAR